MTYRRRRSSYRGRRPRRKLMWHREVGIMNYTQGNVGVADLLWGLRMPPATSEESVLDVGAREAPDVALLAPKDVSGATVVRTHLDLVFWMNTIQAPVAGVPLQYIGVTMEQGGPPGGAQTVMFPEPAIASPASKFYADQVDWMWWECTVPKDQWYRANGTDTDFIGHHCLDIRSKRKIEDRGDCLTLIWKGNATGMNVQYASSVLLALP